MGALNTYCTCNYEQTLGPEMAFTQNKFNMKDRHDNYN